jgi:hypothetical protein
MPAPFVAFLSKKGAGEVKISVSNMDGELTNKVLPRQ